MANALGFWAIELSWRVRGKSCDVSFYIGADAGVDTGDEIVVDSIATAIQGAWNSEAAEFFNPSYLQAMHLPTTSFNDFRCLYKGGIGLEARQVPLNKPIVGTRNPISDADLLPPQVTVSSYAPRVLLLGRGAKVGFSGGVERDWDSDQWSTAAGDFWDKVNQFVTDFNNFVGEVGSLASQSLVSVVVPRIPYVAPSGKPSNRLPQEASDAANTITISAYVPSLQAGSKNKMKIRLR